MARSSYKAPDKHKLAESTYRGSNTISAETLQVNRLTGEALKTPKKSVDRLGGPLARFLPSGKGSGEAAVEILQDIALVSGQGPVFKAI